MKAQLDGVYGPQKPSWGGVTSRDDIEGILSLSRTFLYVDPLSWQGSK